MPGVSRFGINKIKEHLAAVVANGLTSVLLFGVTDKLQKVIVCDVLSKSCFFLDIS